MVCSPLQIQPTITSSFLTHVTEVNGAIELSCHVLARDYRQINCLLNELSVLNSRYVLFLSLQTYIHMCVNRTDSEDDDSDEST